MGAYDVPKELIEAWHRRNVTVLVGAGVSVGSGLPTWSDMVDALVRDLPEAPPAADLPGLARYFELAHGRHRLISVVSDMLWGQAKPNVLHRSIAALRPQAVLTTNFDDLIEQALRAEPHPYSVVVSDDEVPFISAAICPVVKLHGSLDRPGSMILTSRDYELYEQKRPAVARHLGAELQVKTLLLVGYSARDPDFRTILSRIQEQTSPHSRRLFMLAIKPTRLERLELDSRGVKVIDLGSVDGHEATVRASEWVDAFRHDLGTPSKAPDRRSEPELINGKLERTNRLVGAARHLLSRGYVSQSIVRLRQGYSSLSLGDNDHPDEPDYSRLLRQERDAFHSLLRAGCQFRVIVGYRSVHSAGPIVGASDDLRLAKRLRDRCSRLIDLIADVESGNVPGSLVVVCTRAPHLSDVALGSEVVFKGVRWSDSGSGYNVTVVSRNHRTVHEFCASFDREFEGLAKRGNLPDWDRESIQKINKEAIAELTKSLTRLNYWLARHR